MKKALKSILAVVLALTMIMSCSFAATASAASANAAPTDVSVSEIPQIIAGLVKIGIEVAKKAYEYYDKYVPDSVKDFNSTVAKDAAGAVKNLAKIEPLKVLIGGKEYDVSTPWGLIMALAKMETDKEKTSILMTYLDCIFTKIISFIADMVPLPRGLTKLEDYKPESENFYKGSKEFVSEASKDAKWQRLQPGEPRPRRCSQRTLLSCGLPASELPVEHC